MSALVIAAHGTRLEEGQQQCRELIARVAGMLPDVAVTGAYVELDTPTIQDAVADALAADEDKHVVVVPLMIGTGGHVRDDIPEGIAAGQERVPGGRVTYAPHLGPDPMLRGAVRERVAEACGDWPLDETTVVFLGRGALVTDANADHVRLGRVLLEEAGWADVEPAFIQVVKPDLTTALDRAYAHGARKIVVMPHYLFHGRLEKWAQSQTQAWLESHPDAQARVADVIGDCDELAQVVVDRYTSCAQEYGLRKLSEPGQLAPVYLAGLVLRSRKVLIAGGGRVAARRIGKLIDAGARIHVVAPEATETIRQFAAAGVITLSQREVTQDDLQDCWYALALTDSPEVNKQVIDWAQQAHVFCVRGDDALRGTAWTPATGQVDGLIVGVVGNREPHRSAKARTAAVAAIAEAERA